MRLYLARHGQTEWNAGNRAQGHADIGLDEQGQKQANALADRLCELDIGRVLTSDLSRCVLTLEPYLARCGLRPELRRDLRERTFGDMEGTDFSELHVWMRAEAMRLGVADWQVRPPNGESMDDVWKRLDGVVEELRSESLDTLVVSHGGALAQLLAKLLRGTRETPRSFRFDNCGLTALERRPDGAFWLRTFNDCWAKEACERESLG